MAMPPSGQFCSIVRLENSGSLFNSCLNGRQAFGVFIPNRPKGEKSA